jgi:hypothetical protein
MKSIQECSFFNFLFFFSYETSLAYLQFKFVKKLYKYQRQF